MEGARAIRRIVIVGGGTAGWMAAAVFAKTLGRGQYSISLVESDEIGTVGVGEATIPPMQILNRLLGLNEDEFLRATQATLKLGIEFIDWGALGTRYFHPFGQYGRDMEGIPFHHFWLRLQREGGGDDFGRFNAETEAARQSRFGRVPGGDARLPDINYAYQFDAGLYAAFLRKQAEAGGVRREEGRVVDVRLNATTGFVESLVLQDGRSLDGDLFIDCSGFRGLLIENTLQAGYEDWSEWLPCDRAAAVPCEHGEEAITPYTRSTAREAGWQWRIPLRHRIGNGYVFCSRYLSEDEACANLLERLSGPALAEPRVLRFQTGHRRRLWDRNVIAIGLSSGFLEPLESTSIHLAQYGITRLVGVLPDREINPQVVARYNRDMLEQYTNVKDFLIAHYKVTRRDDTPFWRYCRDMDMPDSLRERLDIFAATGETSVREDELFKAPSWFAVLVGQGLVPQRAHPIAGLMSSDDLRLRLSQYRTAILDRVKGLPTHKDFLGRIG